MWVSVRRVRVVWCAPPSLQECALDVVTTEHLKNDSTIVAHMFTYTYYIRVDTGQILMLRFHVCMSPRWANI